MKIIEQLRAKLAAVGATLDEGDGYTLNCDAPSGYVWQANDCTTIAIHVANNSQSWASEAIRKDGMPRLKMGLRKVTDTDERDSYRYDLGDDTWGAADDAPETIPFN